MSLTTARLIQRDSTAYDRPGILVHQSHPLHLPYLPWTERTEEDVRRFANWFLGHQAQQRRTGFQLAVILKTDGRLIGNCGIRMAAEASARPHEGEIGYELSPDEWGRGYATEAAREIVRFGFETLGLHRIGAWCVADNTASARVLEKLGMTLEGRLRDKEHYKGRYWDVLMYGMVREDTKYEVRDTS